MPGLTFGDAVRQHIQKEDNVLFRMAKMILAPDDVTELAREFAAVEVPDRFLAEAAMSCKG